MGRSLARSSQSFRNNLKHRDRIARQGFDCLLELLSPSETSKCKVASHASRVGV